MDLAPRLLVRPRPSDLLGRSLPDAPAFQFQLGEVVRVRDHPLFGGDPAQVVHFDPSCECYTVKVFPRLDYEALAKHTEPPPRPPLAAFVPQHFAELGLPLEHTQLPLGDLVNALRSGDRVFIAPFEYLTLDPENLEVLAPGSLTAVEKRRFRDHVAVFERRIKNFEAVMARSLAWPVRPPGPAPPLWLSDAFPVQLSPRYAAVDGEKLEDEAARRRCGLPNPSFAQLHSRRRLLAAVDPCAMVDFMRTALGCIREFHDRAAEGSPNRDRVQAFQAELATLEKLDVNDEVNGAPFIRRIQTAYFNQFIPLMDDVRKDEAQRVKEEEDARRGPSADWFVPAEGMDDSD